MALLEGEPEQTRLGLFPNCAILERVASIYSQILFVSLIMHNMTQEQLVFGDSTSICVLIEVNGQELFRILEKKLL